MAAKLYATNDVVASIQRAHEAFTHVLVNRSYASIRPTYFRSEKLSVEPIFSYAPWEPASLAQLERWRANGGVLIDRNSVPDKAGETDVLIFVEAPFSLARVTRATALAHEHVIIARPHVWRTHEEAIELRAPPVETLQEIWKHIRGRRMTDLELVDATGIPMSRLQYMCAGLKPGKELEMRPRLAPQAPGLLPAWEWINAGDGAGCTASRKAVRLAGHKNAVRELARHGHIALTKYLAFGAEEPQWEKLASKRAAALADLAAVRALVESLPDHLEA
ncbi:hypothetical protein [Paraburkholderia acidiphila]|uniref:Uncharacterized protein n=1 Tax=Paraburkholderia acidiphila TaxID=2571747 RepID=A0A7Z2G3V3_9BURK|nr:hypothetical protein [Paraburkholderia acidiphila]QGZ54304.1 hypothetical protein FAZ97_04880 [Paraburkholderia acidiphila]